MLVRIPAPPNRKTCRLGLSGVKAKNSRRHEGSESRKYSQESPINYLKIK